jgi:hypothetical protein
LLFQRWRGCHKVPPGAWSYVQVASGDKFIYYSTDDAVEGTRLTGRFVKFPLSDADRFPIVLMPPR